MTRPARLEILEAEAPILVGRILFVVDRDVVREFVVGPHGDTVRQGDSRRSLNAIQGASIEGYLPRGWTYEEFMLAWTFWAQGFERGYSRASSRSVKNTWRGIAIGQEVRWRHGKHVRTGKAVGFYKRSGDIKVECKTGIRFGLPVERILSDEGEEGGERTHEDGGSHGKT